jgi:C4-dicarboxylate transporter
MQPISIEPISVITLIVVILTFIYSFFKYRSKDKKQETPEQTKQDIYDYEKPVIVAAIAMMLEEKPFKIKNIVLSGKQEKVSSWRQFGRQEIMRRRMNLNE